jgi:hypothetical protein
MSFSLNALLVLVKEMRRADNHAALVQERFAGPAWRSPVPAGSATILKKKTLNLIAGPASQG